jgi:hypothetical protein
VVGNRPVGAEALERLEQAVDLGWVDRRAGRNDRPRKVVHDRRDRTRTSASIAVNGTTVAANVPATVATTALTGCTMASNGTRTSATTTWWTTSC